jgi:hypothetical protein
MCPERRSQRRRGVVARGFWETVTGTGPCRLACEWAGSLVLAFAQSGGVKANQPNPASAPVKNHPLEDRKRHLWVTTIRRPSQSPSPMCPTPKSQSPQRGLTARRSPSLRGALRSLRPDTTHSDGNGSIATMDRNEFVREVLTPNYVLRLAAHPLPFIYVFLFLVA